MAQGPRDRVPVEPQSVDSPLSRAAVFLVVTIAPGDVVMTRARSVIAGIGELVRAVGVRDLSGHLSCNVGMGSTAWDRLGRERRPAQLRTFTGSAGLPTLPSRLPVTCSSTFAPSAATYVSSWKDSCSTR
jgi:hypothetical protein